MLVSLAIVFSSLVLNIKYISPKLLKEADGYDVFHSIFHLVAMSVFAGMVVQIVPNTHHGWSMLGIVAIVVALSYVYGYLNSRVLKYSFVVIFLVFALYHIIALGSVLRRIDRNDLEYLRILQYATSLLLIVAYWVYNKYNTLTKLSGTVFAILGLYLFIITTLYVEDIFNSSFAITIYWGVLSFAFLMRGIGDDKPALRTIGLYIITLTAGKIFFYDIWYGLNNGISRVVALIFVGILLIIISTRYTKRYGNNLTGEFQLDNLWGASSTQTNQKVPEVSTTKKSDTTTINTAISDIDVSAHSGVRFI